MSNSPLGFFSKNSTSCPSCFNIECIYAIDITGVLTPLRFILFSNFEKRPLPASVDVPKLPA